MIILIYWRSFERSMKLKKEKMRLSDFKRYNVLKGFELKRICSMYSIFQLQRGFPVFRNILTFFFSSPKDWMSQKATSLQRVIFFEYL